MSAKFRAAASSASSSITVPAGVVTGDLLLLFFSKLGGTYADPAADGFTQLNTSTITKLYWKIATAADVGATFSGYGGKWMMLAAYYDILGSDPIGVVSPDAHSGNSSTFSTPSIVASKVGMRVVDFVRASKGSDTGITTYPATMRAKEDGYTYDASIITDFEAPAAGATPQRQYGSFNDPSWYAVVVSLNGNTAPNAPLVSDQGTFNRAVTNRVSWTFSDPDLGDTQSAAEVRHRPDGTTTWMLVEIGNPNQFWDAPSGTFVEDLYEAQVRTADQAGVWGPWSASFFIDAADAPLGATILAPTSGATIGTSAVTVDISAANVDEAEYRLYADDGAGNIDPTTQLQPAVVKATGDLRSHTWTGLANNVPVWLWVRIKNDGLWSEPTTQRNPVSFTPPPAPTLTLAASNAEAAVAVTVSNPAPAEGEPAVSYVDLYVRCPLATPDADPYRPYSEAGTRIRRYLTPDSLVLDRLAASGVDYEYQAVAVAENGTTAASAWVSTAEQVESVIYYGGGY